MQRGKKGIAKWSCTADGDPVVYQCQLAQHDNTRQSLPRTPLRMPPAQASSPSAQSSSELSDLASQRASPARRQAFNRQPAVTTETLHSSTTHHHQHNTATTPTLDAQILKLTRHIARRHVDPSNGRRHNAVRCLRQPRTATPDSSRTWGKLSLHHLIRIARPPAPRHPHPIAPVLDEDPAEHTKAAESSAMPIRRATPRQRGRGPRAEEAGLERVLPAAEDAAPVPASEQPSDHGHGRHGRRRPARQHEHGLAAQQGAHGPRLRPRHRHPELRRPRLAGRPQPRLRHLLRPQARRQAAHGPEGVRVLQPHQEEPRRSDQQLSEWECGARLLR